MYIITTDVGYFYGLCIKFGNNDVVLISRAKRIQCPVQLPITEAATFVCIIVNQ